MASNFVHTLETICGYSHCSVFFMSSCGTYPCDFDGNFKQGSDESCIRFVSDTPFEPFLTAKNLETLWYQYSDPSDIRNYRSPHQLSCYYKYKYKELDAEEPVKICINIRFNDTFEIYFSGVDGLKIICSGKTNKCAWDMTANDIEDILEEQSEKIENYLTANVLQAV